LAQFEADGLFAEKTLNRAHFGPDSEFLTVLVKSGKQSVQMRSWHELREDSGKVVADLSGATALDGRRRLEVLRKSPSDYLFFRFVWSEARARLAELIPSGGTRTAGKPVMTAAS
jgi:hypothetical protein